MKMTKTFTRGGQTIEVPKGCPSLRAHLATCEVNLGICRRLPHLAKLIPAYEADIKKIKSMFS